jgi:two-component system sensor histidine kinase MprB
VTSLRLKIALSMALLALMATAAVGAVGYRSTSSRLIDEVDRSISDASALVVTLTDRNGRVRVPRRGTLGIYSVNVVGVDGDTVGTSFDEPLELSDSARRALDNPRARAFETAEVGDQRYRVLTIGLDGGAAQIGRPLTETDRVLEDLRRRTTLLVALVSVAAAAAGWLIAGTVAGPLRRLTNAAERVEESGNLDVDLPAAGSDEVGRLAHAFRSMLGALDRSRSQQQRLVQDAGHELRTPLTSLKTNLAVLRRHTDMEPDMQRRIFDDLDTEVTELTDLVNELVSVASGQFADEPSDDLDLGEIAASVAERVGRRRSRNVVVDVSAAGGVHASRSGIERAITNLIENAAKFDTSGGDIEVIVDGGAVTVLDRGPGIPVDDLPLIFDRFHRATSARTMPGSGLGLAIVREIVERHGGTVRAAARPGGGAEVGFVLPRLAVTLR